MENPRHIAGRFALLAAIATILLAGIPAAQPYNNSTGAYIHGLESAAPQIGTFGGSGWFADWRALSAIAIAISLSIIALAYMASNFLGMQELKVWASIEFVQVVGSAIIIMALIGTIQFTDTLSRQVVENNFGSVIGTCPQDKLCTVVAANFYLEQLKNVSDKAAFDVLSRNVDYARVTRYGIQANIQWLLWSGFSMVPGAGITMLTDKMAYLFDSYAKISASLSAQQAFVNEVAFNIGPAFILLGVVLRTFFFTRKLGGLLLAIAVGLMLVLPLLYAFAWWTMKITVFGPQAVGPDPNCPDECKYSPPYAYLGSNPDVKFTRANFTMNRWNETHHPRGIMLCDKAIGSMNNLGALDGAGCDECPEACRDYPFPSQLDGCNEEACTKECSQFCKVRRIRTDCSLNEVCPTSCTESCKFTLPRGLEPIIPPYIPPYTTISPYPGMPSPGCEQCLGYDADGNGTIDQSKPDEQGCPYYCRVYTEDASGNPVASDKESCNIESCTSFTRCQKDCRTLLPQVTQKICDDSCDGCPEYCRINVGPQYIIGTDFDECDTTECRDDCPVECKSTPPAPSAFPDGACAAFPDIAGDYMHDCKGCPYICRATSDSAPEECAADAIIEACYNDANCASTCRTNYTILPCDVACGCKIENRTAGLYGGSDYWFPHGSDCNNVPACTNPDCVPRIVDMYGATYTPFSWVPWGMPAGSCGNCRYECRFTNLNSTNEAWCINDAYYAEYFPSSSTKLIAVHMACNGLWVNASHQNVSGPPYYYHLPSTGPPIPGISANPLYTHDYCPDSMKANNDGENVPYYYCDEAMQTGTTADGVVQPIGNYTNPLLGDWTPRAGNHEQRRGVGFPSNITIHNYTLDASGLPVEVPGFPQTINYNRPDTTGCGFCYTGCRYDDPANSNCGNQDAFYSACLQQGYSHDNGAGVISLPPEPRFGSEPIGECPKYCRHYAPPTPDPFSSCKPYDNRSCMFCPAYCRADVTYPGGMCPQYCNSGSCLDSCKASPPPFQPCQECAECEEDCLAKNSVRTDCSLTCNAPSGDVAYFTPADFINKIGAEGDPDTKNLGILSIPALVLPLFNFVMLLAFIRVLSPVMGGDIEIPGLTKLI
jgi:hypothetical protein